MCCASNIRILWKLKGYANKCGGKISGKISSVSLLGHSLKPINSFLKRNNYKKQSKILSLSLFILFEIVLKARKSTQTAGQERRASLFIDNFAVWFCRFNSLKYERSQFSLSCSFLQVILFLLRTQMKCFC